jgi:type IV secretion system protein VirB10
MSDKTPSLSNLSPVFARAERVRPKVQQPDSPWTVPLGVVGALAIGALVFGSLSNGRAARAEPSPRPAAARPIQLAQAPQPVNPPAPQPVNPPAPAPVIAPPMVQQDPNEAHYRSPTMVVDLTGPAGGTVQVAPGAVPAGVPTSPEDARMSADERFAARVSGSSADVARATFIRDLARMVPQGAVIPAVLETALDSDLPGSVRGVVSRDVKSFDGSQVLIPRGSKLIGQYKSAVAIGQTRAFVVWSRLITPSGVSIDIGSPAADRLGRGGLDGKVDDHFFRRFGAAILLSVIDAGLQAATTANSGTSLYIGSPTQANRVAEIALQKQIDIPVTIRVPAGQPVQVFVARDLDFSAVAPR